MRSYMILMVLVVAIVAMAVPASARRYGSVSDDVNGWSGINATEAYRDLPPDVKVDAAIALTGQAIQRGEASVRYADAQAMKANLENVRSAARTFFLIKDKFKGKRRRRSFCRW